MIKPIYTFNTSILGKKIYIHGVDKTAIGVFLVLALKDIDVSGFVTDSFDYVGKTIMNREIIHVNQIPSDGVIISSRFAIPPQCYRDVPIYSYDEGLELNSELKNYDVVIYGYGNRGKQFCTTFLNNGIHVVGFCGSHCTMKECMGEKILSIDEIDVSNKAFVIATDNENYQKEMLEKLAEKKAGIVFCDHYISEVDCMNIIFIQSVSKAINECKKIYIWGNDLLSNQINQMLVLYGYCNGVFIDENILTELIKRDNFLQNSHIIIAEFFREKISEKANRLEKIGFRLEDFSFSAPYVYIRPINLPKRISDSHFGFTNIYQDDIPGFLIHTSQGIPQIKILILGNSTSEEKFQRVRSWVEILHDILELEGNGNIIFNGSHAGNNSCMNLGRLIRDGFLLKPDIVISFSGIQDIYYRVFYSSNEITNRFNTRANCALERKFPSTEFCHGIQNDNSPFEDWKRDEESIHAISKIYGAKSITVLQPMNMGRKSRNLFEQVVFHDEIFEKGSKLFRESAKNDDFYLNWIGLFDDIDKMYIDTYHYSQKGHQIIAEMMFEELKKLDIGIK